MSEKEYEKLSKQRDIYFNMINDSEERIRKYEKLIIIYPESKEKYEEAIQKESRRHSKYVEELKELQQLLAPYDLKKEQETREKKEQLSDQIIKEIEEMTDDMELIQMRNEYEIEINKIEELCEKRGYTSKNAAERIARLEKEMLACTMRIRQIQSVGIEENTKGISL